jgi:hypothetical protein
VGDKSVNAVSSSGVGSGLAGVSVSVAGAAFWTLGKRPNPERIPLSANFSTLRHHGTDVSAICDASAAQAAPGFFGLLKGGSSSERQEREANPPKSIPQGLQRLRETAAFLDKNSENIPLQG